jgi:hypothetical protein
VVRLCQNVVLGLFLWVLGTARADAQILRRIEESHQAPPKKPAESNVSASHSSSRTSNGNGRRVASEIGQSVTEPTCNAFGPALLYSLCIVPSFSGLCIDTSYRIGLDAYAEQRLYVPTEAVPASHPALRHLELRFSGFGARKLRVFGAGAELRAWIGPMMIAADWTKLVEPSAPDQRSLDVARLKLGANLALGARVELYPTMGLLLLYGEKLTPAFNVGFETRIYPLRPFVFFSSIEAAFFSYGAPLAEIRLEPGLTFGAFDVRAGLRIVHQTGTATFGGPSLSLGGRL